MRTILFIALVLLSVTYTTGQGRIDGFYKSKNEGSLVLGLGYEQGTEYYAGISGTLELERSVYYANVFGAYGITNNLNVNLSIPFIASDDNADFQDIAVFLKYRVYTFSFTKWQLEISAALGFSTNLTDYDLGGLNDIGQQATIFDGRLMLHLNSEQGWFATLQSGYSAKSSPTPDSLPLVLKVGKATSNWYYDLYYDFQDSDGGIDYRGTPRPQDFRAFGVDYHKVGATLYRPISQYLGIYGSLSYVLDGRNIFGGPGFGAGLVYNF